MSTPGPLHGRVSTLGTLQPPPWHQAISMLAGLAHASRRATDLGHTRANSRGTPLSTWIRPALQSACFGRSRDPLHRDGAPADGALRISADTNRAVRRGETHRSGHASERRGDSLALGTKPGGRLAPG